MGVNLSEQTRIHIPLESEQRIGHHCGVFAIYYTAPTSTQRALADMQGPYYALQHRGQEGMGATLAFTDSVNKFSSVSTKKYEGLVKQNFKTLVGDMPDGIVKLALGQLRYSTSKGTSEESLQPCEGDYIFTSHNGNLTNPVDLLTEHPDLYQQHLDGMIHSDTYALHLAIEAHIKNGMPIAQAIETVTNKAEGSFMLMIMSPSEGALYVRSDPWLNRPAVVGHLNGNRGIIVASETPAFEDLAYKVGEINPGECIRISQSGVDKVFTDPRTKERKSCIFELIYFARPDGIVFGVPVSEYRYACGEWLAEQDYKAGFVPDLICGVQKSGLIAGEGYGARMRYLLSKDGRILPEQAANISQQTALLTSSYAGRNFLEPKDRQASAKLKYSVNERLVRGKDVVIVEDSLVRGDTSIVIDHKLKVAGARSVHMRVASPPIRHPCYMGIDFATYDELVAHNRTVEEVCAFIGANSLLYLDVDAANQIAYDLGSGQAGYCNACFDGKYYVPIDPNKMILKQPH